MFEEMYEALPSVDGYLARIGYKGSREPTLSTLNALIRAHLLAVPFENIDLYDLGLSISVRPTDLYKKIVENRRGGYCFELNGLFYSLLEALGFRCTAGATRPALAGLDTERPGALSHRFTIVHLDGRRYFADVGFGGPSPVGGLDLDIFEPQQIGGEVFLLEERDEHLFLCRLKDGERRYTHMFTTHRFYPPDFAALSMSMFAAPTSIFLTRRMVNLRTETGTRSIENNIFRRRENGVVTERVFGDAELWDILKDEFGIVIS